MKNPIHCLPLLVLISLFLMLANISYGQSQTEKSSFTFTLLGEVTDSAAQQAVPYATIALQDDQDNLITAVAADAKGKFKLDVKLKGLVKLNISSIGYSPLMVIVEIDGNSSRIDLGKLLLTQGLEIQEVVVAAQRPLIKVDPDKMTYNVEADPEAETGTVLEILRKVPQLTVDGEENVLLNGQSDYKVLVNGKSSTLMSNNFKDIIKSMPANSIKDIEVITNPSTKYESEGIGGIINIITNKRNISGYSGRVGVGFGSHDSYNTSAYISAQIGKFSMSANYSLFSYNNPGGGFTRERENFLSEDLRRISASGKGKNKGLGQSLSIEASYEIDTFNLLSFSMWGYSGRHKYKGWTDYMYYDSDGNPTLDYMLWRRKDSYYNSYSGSMDYQRSFKKQDRTLTFSYKFDLSPGKNENSSRVEQASIVTENRRSKNRSHGDEHTFQVDYYDPVTSKHHLEAGLKYILRINTSDTDNHIMENGIWEDDNDRLADLDYTQHIFGAYGGYLFKLEKFTFKAGYRMEGTWNEGESKSRQEKNRFDNSQFNFIPYVNLSYMIKPSQSVTMSYTQRINRPGIWLLNPYENDSDSTNISRGNPNLDAVVSHSLNFNYSLSATSWNFYTSVYGSYANNNISSYVYIDDNDRTITTYENIGKMKTAGINSSFSYRLTTKLNISISGYGSYREYTAEKIGSEQRRDGFTYGGNTNIGVALWKYARFNASVGYNKAGFGLQSTYSDYFWHSFGITQKFLKEKLDITFNIREPFRKYITFETTQRDDTFYSYSKDKMTGRRLSFRLGYRFGKTDISVKKAKRSISNDDRMGSEGGSTGGE